MSVKKEMYQDIEIRYGYAITDDRFHAHFELPAERHCLKSAASEARSTTPVAQSLPGKMHIHSLEEGELLDEARLTIDRFLGK